MSIQLPKSTKKELYIENDSLKLAFFLICVEQWVQEQCDKKKSHKFINEMQNKVMGLQPYDEEDTMRFLIVQTRSGRRFKINISHYSFDTLEACGIPLYESDDYNELPWHAHIYHELMMELSKEKMQQIRDLHQKYPNFLKALGLYMDLID